MLKKITIMSASLAVICSCSREQIGTEAENTGLSPLVIKSIGVSPTKALFTGQTLTGSFGAMLAEDGSDTYDGLTYENVKFTSSGSEESVIWGTDTDIMLSTTVGTLYSYYPYSESVSDMRAIPVQATSSVQTDYMYGTPVTALSNKNTSAAITMNHALAAVRLSIEKGSFTGDGVITKVSVNGEAIATGAMMDAATGVLSGFSGQGTRISPEFTSFALSSAPQEKDFIIIPTGNSSPMTIAIEIDGIEIKAETPAADFAEGTIANYSVIVNAQGLKVSAVSVTPWQTTDKGEIEIL